MIINGKQVSSAQRGRQNRRHADGKYSKMVNCYAGCGRRLNPDGDYCSHQLTDTRDANGEGFGDTGLIICDPCSKACATQTTLREFIAFVRTQDAHLAGTLEWAADHRRAEEQQQATAAIALLERASESLAAEVGHPLTLLHVTGCVACQRNAAAVAQQDRQAEGR